jgi:hypothetical protein
MFLCLIAIGGLGFGGESKSVQMAIGILLVISTLCNMITVGELHLNHLKTYPKKIALYIDTSGNRASMLSHCGRDTIWEIEIQDNRHREIRIVGLPASSVRVLGRRSFERTHN